MKALKLNGIKKGKKKENQKFINANKIKKGVTTLCQV